MQEKKHTIMIALAVTVTTAVIVALWVVTLPLQFERAHRENKIPESRWIEVK